ncbi:hypothetical protein D9M70_256540 [compost metagenome]
MVPAWFISTVIAPKRSSTWATALLTWSATETSVATKHAVPPAALIRSATALPSLRGRSRMATLAPSRAKSSEAARPQPPAPPVISATLPFNRPMECLLSAGESVGFHGRDGPGRCPYTGRYTLFYLIVFKGIIVRSGGRDGSAAAAVRVFPQRHMAVADRFHPWKGAWSSPPLPFFAPILPPASKTMSLLVNFAAIEANRSSEGVDYFGVASRLPRPRFAVGWPTATGRVRAVQRPDGSDAPPNNKSKRR